MPLVRCDFFAPNDLNGTVRATLTSEDDIVESVTISPRLRELGGGAIVLTHDPGGEITHNIIGSEAFVRFVVPSIDATKYLWGMFINVRERTLVSVDEKGGEKILVSGLGPKFYLDRAILWDEEFGPESGIEADPDNGVFNVNDNINIGSLMVRLIAEDAANTIATFLPDLTLGFTATNDSNGSAFTPNHQVGEDFTLAIGESFLQHLWAAQESIDDDNAVEFVVDLGEVGSPTFQLDAHKTYGRNLTGTDFGAGIVLLKEGVNLEGEVRKAGFGYRPFSSQATGIATRRASHALVQGATGVYGRAVLSGYSPGDYAKAVAIDAGNFSSETVLDRKGLRWLRHQENGDNEFELTITPGFDETNGLYMAGPNGTNGHVWPGDTVTLKTGDDVFTALEYDYTSEWVTGIDLTLREAAKDDTTQNSARSWDLSLLLNVERGSDNPARNEGGGPGGGSGRHHHPPNPKLCPAAIDCDDLGDDDLEDGTAANGDVEAGASTQWTGGAAQAGHFHGGAQSYGATSGTSFDFTYTFDPAQVFTAGTRYVIEHWNKLQSGSITNEIRFGVADGDEEIGAPISMGDSEGDDGDTWRRNRFCWTPSADRTGVRFRRIVTAGSSGFYVIDDLALYTTDNNELAGTSKRAARCDHAHHARDVVLSGNAAGLDDADTVQEGFEELVALIGTGEFVKRHSGGEEDLSTVAASGSTETIDLADGNGQDITLTDDCTFTFPSVTSGKLCSFTLILRQDGTGGRTATWPGSVEWPGSSAPTLATAASAVDVLTFLTVDGGTTWLGFHGSAAAAVVAALDDLTDVTITAPALADRLRFDGSEWVNSPLFHHNLTAFDGTNWSVLFDGDGNCLYAEG